MLSREVSYPIEIQRKIANVLKNQLTIVCTLFSAFPSYTPAHAPQPSASPKPHTGYDHTPPTLSADHIPFDGHCFEFPGNGCIHAKSYRLDAQHWGDCSRKCEWTSLVNNIPHGAFDEDNKKLSM